MSGVRLLACAVIGQAVNDGERDWFNTQAFEMWAGIADVEPDWIRARLDKAIHEAKRHGLRYVNTVGQEA